MSTTEDQHRVERLTADPNYPAAGTRSPFHPSATDGRDRGSLIPNSSTVYAILPKLQGQQDVTRLSKFAWPPRDAGDT